MIDPKEPKPIRFSDTDQPELSEIDQQLVEAHRRRREQVKEMRRQWLENHFSWRPFGDEW